MGPAVATPLAQVLGDRLHAIRRAGRVRQDTVAATARRWGLPWTRATIAALETGRRGLSVEEFLWLPYVLSLSECRLPERPSQESFIELADVFPDRGWLALTPNARVEGRILKRIVRGRAAKTWPSQSRWIEVPARRIRAAILRHMVAEGDAERNAARVLGVSADDIADAALTVWQRGLTDERDRRVQAQAAGDTPPRALQAIRGHVTRTLLKELGTVIARRRRRHDPARGAEGRRRRSRRLTRS